MNKQDSTLCLGKFPEILDEQAGAKPDTNSVTVFHGGDIHP